MKIVTGLLAAATLSAVLCTVAPASAQTVTYSDKSTTGLNTTTGVVSYLQAVTPAGTGSGTLSTLTFAIAVAPGTAAQTQTAFFDFYSGLDTSASSANVLGNATYLGGFAGNYTLTANTGTTNAYRSYTYSNLQTLTTPITLQSNSLLGIVTTLADASGQFYSTVVSGAFTTGAPTFGTAYDYIWNDANQDGVFAGTEKTQLGQTHEYSYLSFSVIPNATAAVPEPATWAMMIVGFGLAGAAMRYRRRSTRIVYA